MRCRFDLLTLSISIFYQEGNLTVIDELLQKGSLTHKNVTDLNEIELSGFISTIFIASPPPSFLFCNQKQTHTKKNCRWGFTLAHVLSLPAK